MLQPKKHKFRKAFKGRIKGDAKGGTDLNFGSYGLKAMEPERITARQIEAARRAITRHIKRQGRAQRCGRLDEKCARVGDLAADEIRQSAVREGDVRSPLEHDDLR